MVNFRAGYHGTCINFFDTGFWSRFLVRVSRALRPGRLRWQSLTRRDLQANDSRRRSQCRSQTNISLIPPLRHVNSVQFTRRRHRRRVEANRQRSGKSPDRRVNFIALQYRPPPGSSHSHQPPRYVAIRISLPGDALMSPVSYGASGSITDNACTEHHLIYKMSVTVPA